MAGRKHAGRHPGGLPRPYQADAVAGSLRLQQGVRHRLRAAAWTSWRQQQGVSCDPAVRGTQQALQPGVRSLRSDPYAGDAGEACWPDPRRERHADVANAFRPRESGVWAVELRERGLGGGRRDEPAQRAQLPDGVR